MVEEKNIPTNFSWPKDIRHLKNIEELLIFRKHFKGGDDGNYMFDPGVDSTLAQLAINANVEDCVDMGIYGQHRTQHFAMHIDTHV